MLPGDRSLDFNSCSLELKVLCCSLIAGPALDRGQSSDICLQMISNEPDFTKDSPLCFWLKTSVAVSREEEAPFVEHSMDNLGKLLFDGGDEGIANICSNSFIHRIRTGHGLSEHEEWLP